MGRPKKEQPNHGNLYEVKITIGHTFDGKLIRKSFYSTISKADAKAKAEQYKVNQAVQERTGELSEPKVMTFETWAKKWLETYKKDTVKQHTYLYTYESNVIKYLIPYFKKAKLSEIKQIDIQKYFSTVRADNGQPLAKSTLDKQKMILKDIFDAAIDNDLCFKNPVKNIKYQHVAEKEERNVYTKIQAEAAEAYARQHGGYDIVIMLKTGIRRSELLGLQWNDIDFTNLWIHIQRAVVQTRGQIVIAPPKTSTSDRFIPISKNFAEYLKTMPHNGIYIMGTDEPLSPSTYAKNFSDFMNQMSEEINIPVLTPHELRHTFGTLLREVGVDIYTIQRIMGHSDISVTSSVYVHNDIAVLRRQMGLPDVE
jgi:integrase